VRSTTGGATDVWRCSGVCIGENSNMSDRVLCIVLCRLSVLYVDIISLECLLASMTSSNRSDPIVMHFGLGVSIQCRKEACCSRCRLVPGAKRIRVCRISRVTLARSLGVFASSDNG